MNQFDNRISKPMSRLAAKSFKKQLRKPISGGFAPKRLAINFQPPMLIMQYLVVDSGKLYHHKMRLDSVLRRLNVTRGDVLNYVKNKHHLYFVNGKIRDQQILKFIDKIMVKRGIVGVGVGRIRQAMKVQSHQRVVEEDDFDYLNEDQEYEEDYQDYEEEPKRLPQCNKENTTVLESKKEPTISTKQPSEYLLKNTKKVEQEKESEDFDWDLDMQGEGDFV